VIVTVPAATVDDTETDESVETEDELELVDTMLELDAVELELILELELMLELDTELEEDELLEVELGTPNTTDAVPPITLPENVLVNPLSVAGRLEVYVTVW